MLIEKLRKNEAGQTMVEYVMVIAIIAIVVYMSSPPLSSAIAGMFTRTAEQLAANPDTEDKIPSVSPPTSKEGQQTPVSSKKNPPNRGSGRQK